MSESIRGYHDKVLLTYLIPATVGAAGQRSHSGGAAAAVQRSERNFDFYLFFFFLFILLIVTAPPVVDSVSCSHVLSAHLTLG